MDANETERAEEEGQVTSSVAPQHRALLATREAAATLGAESLLGTTGPFGELKSAERKGILNEARRVLISKKGRGVVFEADTLVAIQEANERFDLHLNARLSTKANDPRADLLVSFRDSEIEFQLKAGSENYIKASIRGRKEGTLLVVPKDVSEEEWARNFTNTPTFGDVTVDTSTNKELLDRTNRCLDRMDRGEPAFSQADLAKRAFGDALTDGIVAVALDICTQKLLEPDKPVDWTRTCGCLLRTSATSAVASYIAGVNTVSTMSIAKHALDATRPFRVARVASCIVPHVFDAAVDLHKLHRGDLSAQGYFRNLAGHAGAGTAEYVLFPVLARFAARCGPFGILVIIVGGALISKFGNTVGKGLFDVLASLPPLQNEGSPASIPGSEFQSRLDALFGSVQATAKSETARRRALGMRRLCEEARCGRRHHARGMCSRHYQRWWRRQRRFSTRFYLSDSASRRPTIKRRKKMEGTDRDEQKRMLAAAIKYLIIDEVIKSKSTTGKPGVFAKLKNISDTQMKRVGVEFFYKTVEGGWHSFARIEFQGLTSGETRWGGRLFDASDQARWTFSARVMSACY